MASYSHRNAAVSAGAFILLLLWDLLALDMPLALLSGGPGGFPLRDHWILTGLLHSGAGYLAWLIVLFLCVSVTWPVGALRRVPLPRRVQLASTALLASAVITLMKSASHTSCPWDLQAFGGVARHLSHWEGWGAYDGGGGRCFPAGHAATGFAFLGSYFALRKDLPGLAKACLLAALAAGFVLGWAQQLRGAHFMSHTLWTGWVCWMVVWLSDPLFSGGKAKTVENPII